MILSVDCFFTPLTAGEIPKQLGDLVSVKVLNLSGNQLSGKFKINYR